MRLSQLQPFAHAVLRLFAELQSVIMAMLPRHHRQMLLPQIGQAGQARLAEARVVLIGCGALGTHLAEQLVRAGVGFLRIVDRDLVETTNLQRQVLFTEADAKEGVPKAIAAARRLGEIDSAIIIDPVVADVHAGNIESLLTADLVENKIDSSESTSSFTRPPSPSCVDLLLDGTDNVETRYLLNDVSVKHHLPWIYGACVGMEGRMMAVRPSETPCLRCIFPDPLGPGELATCDTVGVFGPAASIVASLQATAAVQLLLSRSSSAAEDRLSSRSAAERAYLTIETTDQLIHFDLWRGRFRATPINDARRADCPTCGQRRFDFLDAPLGGSSTTSLCGRDAIQIRPSTAVRLDLGKLASKLVLSGETQRTPHLLRFRPGDADDIHLTIFPDGRAIIHGTAEPSQARSVYAKWVGA